MLLLLLLVMLVMLVVVVAVIVVLLISLCTSAPIIFHLHIVALRNKFRKSSEVAAHQILSSKPQDTETNIMAALLMGQASLPH